MKQKSFTLIELLVVIAIIGLLSSIVLVNLQRSGDKARIAKGLQFSQTVNNALGSEAVGIWTFDEGGLGKCPGADVCDSSGYKNNGTTTASFTTNTPYSIAGTGAGRYALSFNGNNYVQVLNSPSIDITGTNITLESWAYTGTSTLGYIISKGWEDQYNLSVTNYNIQFSVGAYSANYCSMASNSVLPANTWVHLVGTYNGTKLRIYINGNLDKSTDCSISIASKTYPVKIGGNYYCGDGSINSRCFKGLIDDVRIYSRALTSAEIQQHYAEGLERHLSFSKQ